MKIRTVAIVLSVLAVVSALGTSRVHAQSAESMPYLNQRMNSGRWQIRYSLAVRLEGRDNETKRVLETLVRDENPRVANQATVNYLNSFLMVDRSLFDPKVFVPHGFPFEALPKEDTNAALVDYCLGRREITSDGGFRDPHPPALKVIEAKLRDDPAVVNSLTIVGMLGKPDDASHLYPFLDSANDYVLVNAARALIRLGDRARAQEALLRLTEKAPDKHLYYITEALYVLRELGHPRYKEVVLRVLAEVDKAEDIQPNWLNAFILSAAEVSDDVWK